MNRQKGFVPLEIKIPNRQSGSFLRKSACPLVRLGTPYGGDALRWGRLTVESLGLLITQEIAKA